MVKFIKIDTRHENIGKIHAKGLHQPEENSERAVSPEHYSRNHFIRTAWNKENY
jgi:hypothetical protein